jgi:pimeloyl-ACP methyl ester carboxylesterase
MPNALEVTKSYPVHYSTAKIGNLNVFYRDAGPKDAPVLLLLHGFPTSSNMFRNLIPRLAGAFRVIAPDYPGFGLTTTPDHKEFSYTFENLMNVVDGLVDHLGLKKYSMYVMDYGAPVGYRLALRHPERVQALIVQNGNAYDEGLLAFWDPIKKYWNEPTDEMAVRRGCKGHHSPGPHYLDVGPTRPRSPRQRRNSTRPFL